MLWHYTCRHGHDGIERAGFIEPQFQPLLGVRLAWFTDMDPPVREALGLTRRLVTCDRTTWRYPVDARQLITWTGYRRQLLRDGQRVGVWTLENEPGAMPAHWWVSTQPVPVTRWGEAEPHAGMASAGGRW